MLNLGSTYLIVRDMQKSIGFYETLLDMKVSSQNQTRWAQFNIGHACIALFNPEFDDAQIKSGIDLDKLYNEAYLEYKQRTPIKYGNNFVLNFWVDDLNREYTRVKTLNIGEVSDIYLINVTAPYYCFMLEDPDGNQIEITGKYNEG